MEVEEMNLSHVKLIQEIENISFESPWSYRSIKNEIDNSDFFNPDEKRKVMINNIEAIFTRNNLTLQELNTLHGILSSIIRS